MTAFNNQLDSCIKCKVKFICNVKGGGYLHGRDVEIMFIAQNPGASNTWRKDIHPSQVIPFAMNKKNDKYHRFFDYFVKDGFNFYITNIIKCVTPDNISPNEFQINNCKEYLMDEIEFFNPAVIICLGRSASENFNIETYQRRGEIKSVFNTYHPGYMNRKGNTFIKKCYNDCLLWMKGIL
jgi:uracil-DNA glycosylase family 4